MRRFNLLLLIVPLLLLSGCWVADVVTRNVDLDEAKAQLAQAQQALATIEGVVVHMKAQLAAAREAFEATKSEQAAKVVAQFEAAAAAAEAQLPLVRGVVSKAQGIVTDIEVNGGSSVPLWKVALAGLIPFIPKALTFVPGIGPLAGPLATLISNAAWSLAATGRQKQQDAAAEAAAKALPHQVEFAHQLLKVAPADKAAPIKSVAGKQQKLAGVIDTISPLVLALEIADASAEPKAA